MGNNIYLLKNTKKMEEKIKYLIEEFWHDKYVCKLAILDHLRECLEKDNHLKALDIPKTAIEYKNLDKELMDLKIILDFYFVDNQELYIERINKFMEKRNA